MRKCPCVKKGENEEKRTNVPAPPTVHMCYETGVAGQECDASECRGSLLRRCARGAMMRKRAGRADADLRALRGVSSSSQLKCRPSSVLREGAIITRWGEKRAHREITGVARAREGGHVIEGRSVLKRGGWSGESLQSSRLFCTSSLSSHHPYSPCLLTPPPLPLSLRASTSTSSSAG